MRRNHATINSLISIVSYCVCITILYLVKPNIILSLKCWKDSYLIPFFSSTVSKARHRGDILEFSIHRSNNLAIGEAIFHLYIRGQDWIADNIPSLLEEHRHDSIGISLNRLVRSTLQRYTRTDSDYKGPIPKGKGFEVQFNVTDMVMEWIKHPLTPQEIVIKTTKQWMRQIIMFESNSEYVSQ